MGETPRGIGQRSGEITRRQVVEVLDVKDEILALEIGPHHMSVAVRCPLEGDGLCTIENVLAAHRLDGGDGQRSDDQ